MFTNTNIVATGAYFPSDIVRNSDFLDRQFLKKDGSPISKPTAQIIEKLKEITTIEERRYANGINTRHMAFKASVQAIERSGIDKESLGGIIIAHNFGDIQPGDTQGHLVPNLAARGKNDLGIKNPKCFAYDVLFGCPGWLLGMDLAHQNIICGNASSVLVVGVELLSRVVDPHDLDAMLFGDGAGAAVVTADNSESKKGILGYDSRSDCGDELDYLKMGKPIVGDDEKLYINMAGQSVFKYAVNNVPKLITETLKHLQIPFEHVSHFLFHQANGKMIQAMGRQLAELNDSPCIDDKTPMILEKLGNTSVATIPTLLDMMLTGRLDDHTINEGDIAVMASVGAGMHANCLVYKF